MLPEQPNSKQIQEFSFVMEKPLGQGSNGKVYAGTSKIIKGKNIKTSQPVAVKVIDESSFHISQLLNKLLLNEKKVLESVKHKNILQLYRAERIEGKCFFISELYEGGTLGSLIKRKGKSRQNLGGLSEMEALYMFIQIFQGYSQLTERKILHRDLKSENIMIRKNMEPVIIDFGMCEFLNENQTIKSYYNFGSIHYQSPEVYNSREYSEKSDVWSLGVILHRMLTGKYLSFIRKDEEKHFRALSKIQYPEMKLDYQNEILNTLLRKCLAVKTEERAMGRQLKELLQNFKNKPDFSTEREKVMKGLQIFVEEEEIKAEKLREEKKKKEQQRKFFMSKSKKPYKTMK